jgi:thioredoxin 1
MKSKHKPFWIGVWLISLIIGFSIIAFFVVSEIRLNTIQYSKHAAQTPLIQSAHPIETIRSVNQFQKDVLEAHQLVLVDFWATWCQPCRMLSPVVDQIAKEYAQKIQVCRVEIDQNAALSHQYHIREIPTLLFFENGQMVHRLIGFYTVQTSKKQIEHIIQRLL